MGSAYGPPRARSRNPRGPSARTRPSGRRSRTGIRRSWRSRRRRSWRSDRSSRDRRRRGGRAACASPARRIPARGAGRRRPRSRRRRTSRPARKACDEAISGAASARGRGDATAETVWSRSMLDARFDDLTGASPSFRLVEPVGVLEATRAGEVVATLEAAEAAAGRGLWVAGFVTYEAAAGLDPDLVVRSRDADDPFAPLPLAWFAMFERAEETTLPLPRDNGVAAVPADTWVPTTPRDRYESSVDRIRELIAGGETYQVNHTMRLRSRVEGDARGLYRDLCYVQRGAFSAYLDLGRYRILSASPALFFELRDGATVTKPMKGTA